MKSHKGSKDHHEHHRKHSNEKRDDTKRDHNSHKD